LSRRKELFLVIDVLRESHIRERQEMGLSLRAKDLNLSIKDKEATDDC
jgi:hypothetical protein